MNIFVGLDFREESRRAGPVEALGPGDRLVHGARGVDGAHDRADGRACHAVQLDAPFVQARQDAQMGESARAARTKRQTDLHLPPHRSSPLSIPCSPIAVAFQANLLRLVLEAP